MDDLHIEQLLKRLKGIGNFFDVSHQTTFRCCRNAKDGGIQDVTVEIHDAGTDNAQARYRCIAYSDDGKKFAAGNLAATIDDAITGVHWFDLD